MVTKASNEFDEQVLLARVRVKKMDDIDGFRDRELSTIWSALECGLRSPETGAHFDALVMLQDIREKQRAT